MILVVDIISDIRKRVFVSDWKAGYESREIDEYGILKKAGHIEMCPYG